MVKRDRAQLVLVGAITVAIAILGAVILLNTVHSSPEATAETDTRSVAAAEQTLTEIEGDLGRIAVNRSHEGLRGFNFASKDELKSNVWAYENQSLNLTTIDSATVTTVEFNEIDSTGGAIGANESVVDGDYTGNNIVVEDADDVRIFLEITRFEDQGGALQNIVRTGPNTGNQQLDVRDASDVDVEGWGFAGCDDLALPIEIEVINGQGEIRSTDTGDSCTGDFDTVDNWEDVEQISVFNNMNIDDLEASYEIIATGGECGDDEVQCFDDIITQPAFDVAFQNPNVAVDSQIRLWEDES